MSEPHDPQPRPTDTVSLLNEAAAGRPEAINDLLPIVYEQLRRAAQEQMNAERAGHTLSATALVHEAYLRLVGPRDIPWQGRAHFYAAAAEAIRRILLDHAKARGRAKRGGQALRINLDAAATLAEDSPEHAAEFLALDDALCRLTEQDGRAAQVVRLRYFAGLSIAETAQSLGVAERTVKNDWTFARAWLARELGELA